MRVAEAQVPQRVADQAAGLRRVILAREPGMLAVSGADARDYAPLALALAAGCERDGRRVLLLDLTRGELARELAQATRYELMHVIDAHRRLEDVVLNGPRGVPLLPAARGVRALAQAWLGRSRFAGYIERAGGAPQLVLAVAPAEALETLAQLADFSALLVIGPQCGVDLKPCYAALKRAQAACGSAPRLIYAGDQEAGSARRTHTRLIQTARAFLGGEPGLVGRLSPDPAPTASREFPSLTVEQLARTVAGWPLPRLAAAAVPRTASPPAWVRGELCLNQR